MFEAFKRAEATVHAGPATTAAEALGKMAMFTTLCIRHHVSVNAEANRDPLRPAGWIVVTGRRWRLDRFLAEHARLQSLGCL